VPVYLTNPDLEFADKHVHPRLSGQMPFIKSLDMIMREVHGSALEYHTFGKPAKATFDYALEVLSQQAAERDIAITNTYMIGDNPMGDIVGANRAGIRSILVRSGIYTADKKHMLKGDAMPSFEVANMEEAVKLIMQLEGL